MKLKTFFHKYLKIFINWLAIWIQGTYFDRKNTPHSLCKCITTSEICGFGIGYDIGRKYWPIRVWVWVSDLNQNSGFGRSLSCANHNILCSPINLLVGNVGSRIWDSYFPALITVWRQRPKKNTTKLREGFLALIFVIHISAASLATAWPSVDNILEKKYIFDILLETCLLISA